MNTDHLQMLRTIDAAIIDAMKQVATDTPTLNTAEFVAGLVSATVTAIANLGLLSIADQMWMVAVEELQRISKSGAAPIHLKDSN